MENRASTELLEKISTLATSFAKELPDKICEIEAAWSDFSSSSDLNVLQELHLTVHKLAGNGKIFGFPELSEEARALEQLLKQLAQKDAVDSLSDSILQQISVLRRVLAEKESASTESIAQVIVNEPIHQVSNLIFVVDHDIEAAEELALQLRYYGYEVEIFDQLDEFRSAIKQRPNATILMGIEFPENERGGIAVMKELRHELAQPAQVIFISERDNIELRLEAVRAGSVAFYTKPFNPVELIDQLDLITASQVQDAFRILLIDDNPTVLSYYTTILEQAGMIVKTLNEPMKLMLILKELDPDLILTDLYVSKCNGIELAKVIRQLGSFTNTPIVYLSSEDDFNSQTEAMSLSGDAFLVKPVSSKQLISTITSRVMRARATRSLMVHDGLTNALNHTAIKEELVREVVRSNRLDTPLSFALVDIDFFSKVNNAYGLAAGDRVIKSLSRLLKQRLRGTDIIGRYAGEEFAVIMNDTDAASAAKVIDEIRHVFSRMLHAGHDEEFSVSFSSGIADITNFKDAASLTEAAEKALYQAKQRGRNKVVVNAGD